MGFASTADYFSRLVVWDLEPDEIEYKMIGYIFQLDSRAGAVQRLLRSIQELDYRQGEAQRVVQLEVLVKLSVKVLTFMRSTQSTLAMLYCKIYEDSELLSTCFRACNNFLPDALSHEEDPLILMVYLQRHLDLISLMLSSDEDTVAKELVEISTLACFIGTELYKHVVTQLDYLKAVDSKKTSILDVQYRSEVVFCALCSLLSLFLTDVGESFILTIDTTFSVLLAEILGRLHCIELNVDSYICSVVQVQTLISCQVLISCCIQLLERFVSYIT